MKAELKNQTITVEFKDISNIEKDLLSLAKKKSPKIQPKNIVYFDTMGSFRNFMTLQKLEILALIAEEKLKSVYELAKMLNRAIAPVRGLAGWNFWPASRKLPPSPPASSRRAGLSARRSCL